MVAAFPDEGEDDLLLDTLTSCVGLWKSKDIFKVSFKDS